MSRKDSISIGDMYGKMLNSFKHTIKESNNNAFGDDPKLQGKGPNVDGYNVALNDEKPLPKRAKVVETLTGKLKDPKLSKTQKDKIKKHRDSMTAEEAEEEKSFKESKKNINRMVNNSMSKSVFDKLYNKVLKENFGQDDSSDVDALGLDGSTPDSDLGDDFGGDDLGDEGEGDSVTFTLDRATAQTLIDVLQGALGEGGEGGEEDFGDEGDDLDFGDEGDDFEGGNDDFGGDFEEDEETQGTKPAVDKKKAFQGKSNKVSGPPSPKSGKAKTDVTDETGTKDGAPNFSALQGKNNQVPGSTLKKATDYFK
jgi:hypothetical protein